MSFINGNNNQKINNRNNFYYMRQGNNYQTPYKINNNIFNNEPNIPNNINNNDFNYIDTINKFNTDITNNNSNYNFNENNYKPYSFRNNTTIQNNINNNNFNINNNFNSNNHNNNFNINNNNFSYRNYKPYQAYDPNMNKKFRRYDNFHYFEQNNNNTNNNMNENNMNSNINNNNNNNNNNNFDINTIGKIILSTETIESNDKMNKNRAQKEYSDYLRQQIEEKNKRKKLQREKEMEEDLKLEKQNKEYLKRQKEEMEKEKEKEKLKRQKNEINFNSAKKPVNTIENKKFLIDADINKNLIENIKRAQTPLISDHIKLNKEISNKYNNVNNQNNYEISDIYKNLKNNNNRRPVSSTIVQSGQGIIDGRNFNMRSNDKININNKINNINIYQKYKHEDFFPETNKEENTITNNKYMNYNITNKNNISNEIISNSNYNNNNSAKNEIDNLNETLFNREKYNMSNSSLYNNNNKNSNKINKNYDYTFKNKEIEEKQDKEENPYAISDSLKGSSLEKILDLNNKIDISRSFEDEKNKNAEDSINNNKNNFVVTFGPINEDNNNNQMNFTKSNKGNYDSINSNFTFGKNSQNKNILGVDSIIKNINVGALNYYSKYENNTDENNNNNNKINEKENEYNLEQSMKSVSKLISPSNKGNLLSTWKNESIKEEIENENENEKEIILNNDFINKNLASTKKSLNNDNNENLFITFGEMPKESIKVNNKENNPNEIQTKKGDIINNTSKKIISTLNQENNFNVTKKNLVEDEYEDTEGICNFYKETRKLKNEDISNKVNEALKDAKESSDEEQDNYEDNKKINFFEDTIGKIKKKKNNDKININDRQQLDLIISGEIEDLDTFKSGEIDKKINLNSYKKNYDSNNSDNYNDNDI